MNDIFGVSGLILLAAGTYGRFGWETSAIICGSVLLMLGLIGAMRK